MRRWTVIGLLLTVLVADIATACPVCYGDPNSPMVRGTNNAVWFLLGIVGLVWIGFIALFWSFYQRARALRQRREEFHLIRGGVH